ncbi:MAG: DNA/RNA non-specific endonuclease [Alistipes sp.]|nr:DNA/RNA non-specific endonuclease [Alistipes sp.]
MKKLLALLLSALVLTGCSATNLSENSPETATSTVEEVKEISTEESTEAATVPSAAVTETAVTEPVIPSEPVPAAEFDIEKTPAFSGEPYIVVNDNQPYFSEEEKTTVSFELYSELDQLGRCGTAYACIGTDIMPTEKRGEIGSVKPSGWHSVKYDNVDGKYLYNRCHLIGYQLSGENANVQNLITGTRYLNTEGILPFENMTADYIKATQHHVLYRVTPVFEGDNLLCTGVLMEGLSVEDDDICFNVFCYNAQPDIRIDYSSGDSESLIAATEPPTAPPATEPPTDPPAPPVVQQPVSQTYIANTNTGKFHYPSCSSVGQMNDSNKMEYTGSRDDLIAQGYEPCKRCCP